MKQKELFIEALKGLINNWGSDTPWEVVWGCNDLLAWYEAEYNVSLGVRFSEEESNLNKVIKAIKKS